MTWWNATAAAAVMNPMTTARTMRNESSRNPSRDRARVLITRTRVGASLRFENIGKQDSQPVAWGKNAMQPRADERGEGDWNRYFLSVLCWFSSAVQQDPRVLRMLHQVALCCTKSERQNIT